MSYMLLIVEPPNQRIERGEAKGREVYDQMVRFAADLKERGKLLAVNRSLPRMTPCVCRFATASPDCSMDRLPKRRK